MMSFENVSLTYDGHHTVLNNICFDIEPHSFQFLTGPSGTGKTSLMQMMFLSKKPTSGRIRIFEHYTDCITDHHVPLLRRRIGAVFQEYRLLDHLTIYQNIALPFIAREEKEADPDERKQDILDLLDWVGLKSHIHSYPNTLSSGEKQRAAIARAIISKPDILLADEPTGNVDPVMSKRLLRLFIELNKLGTSVIMATHDISLLELFPARVLYLANTTLKDFEPKI